MKNVLKNLICSRLRSIGMDANDANQLRLLNYVVEKARVKNVLADMAADEIFKAARPEKKEEGK